MKEIVDELSPELIDVNSGVESAPGKKDNNLLLEFFDSLA
jgi:phosphoribosylanthranilate isomerase